MAFELKDFINTNSFSKIDGKISQLDYYINNKSNKDILKLVALNNKAFGEIMQRIVGETLGMSKATSTGHDAIKNGKLIEIKSSRFSRDAIKFGCIFCM